MIDVLPTKLCHSDCVIFADFVSNKASKKHKKLVGLLATLLIFYLLVLPFWNTSGLYFVPF